MITKFEVNGFKTFRNFQMEFSGLTVICGSNASGKSNLFDAFQLLSKLADTDLKTAFSEQRGEAIELFTQYSDDTYADEMQFGVEMLLDKKIKDKFGGEADLKYTRLRYELIICRKKNERGLEDLFVINESLNPLRHNQDKWVKNSIPGNFLEYWRPKVGTGKRGIPYIFTDDKNSPSVIKVPQDGRAGNKREFAIHNISQTILSGFNSVDFPHAFAAKEEIRSWKFLQLNPEQLRKPSSYLAKDSISFDGENLAAALHRIKTDDKTVIKYISRKLNSLLPSLTDIDVFDDKVGRQFIIKIKGLDGREFTSRVLSEGTLRLLSLCVLQFDDQFKGVLCFEEPENGIHPARIKMTAELLKDLTVDFKQKDTSLRQIIVNTHSPVLVGEMFNLQSKSENLISVWFSELVIQTSEMNGKKRALQITKMLPVEKGHPQMALGFTDEERKLTLNKVINYLKNLDFEKITENLDQNHE